jgi:DNA-binding CsgD family transcriptional regulator
VRRFDARLEDQRVVAIAPRDPCRAIDRGDQPAAVLGTSEQRGEAGARIEPRPAQPVDRSGARHERRGLAVADHRVVFEWCAHASVSRRCRRCAKIRFQLVAEAKTNKEIAALLGISLTTVETHRAKILLKLDLHSAAQIALYAVRARRHPVIPRWPATIAGGYCLLAAGDPFSTGSAPSGDPPLKAA